MFKYLSVIVLTVMSLAIFGQDADDSQKVVRRTVNFQVDDKKYTRTYEQPQFAFEMSFRHDLGDLILDRVYEKYNITITDRDEFLKLVAAKIKSDHNFAEVRSNIEFFKKAGKSVILMKEKKLSADEAYNQIAQKELPSLERGMWDYYIQAFCDEEQTKKYISTDTDELFVNSMASSFAKTAKALIFQEMARKKANSEDPQKIWQTNQQMIADKLKDIKVTVDKEYEPLKEKLIDWLPGYKMSTDARQYEDYVNLIKKQSKLDF